MVPRVGSYVQYFSFDENVLNKIAVDCMNISCSY